MKQKRIIPCLDMKDGRIVKGVNFKGLRDAGDIVELAQRYEAEGADELVFLDIAATVESRKTRADLVRRLIRAIRIPLTVGGGIGTIEDVEGILNAGAARVSVNTAAVERPELIDEIAGRFGSSTVVLAIDTRQVFEEWRVVTHGGKITNSLQPVDWAKEGERRGAGEILLTSMSHDGLEEGFAIDITRAVSEAVAIPVIASGGAGTMQHFVDLFTRTKADAALGASVFHFGKISIPVLKQFLRERLSDFSEDEKK